MAGREEDETHVLRAVSEVVVQPEIEDGVCAAIEECQTRRYDQAPPEGRLEGAGERDFPQVGHDVDAFEDVERQPGDDESDDDAEDHLDGVPSFQVGFGALVQAVAAQFSQNGAVTEQGNGQGKHEREDQGQQADAAEEGRVAVFAAD